MARRKPTPASGRPTLLGLLQAVREDADSDEPRLALADWLADQPDPADQARGQFIRHQSGRGTSPEDAALEGTWLATWLGAIPPITMPPRTKRGMVGLNLRPDELFSQPVSDWLATEPGAWVDQLYVSGPRGEHLQWLARLPLLARLTELWLLAVDGEEGDGLADLIASQLLAGLRHLRVGPRIRLAPLSTWLPAAALPRLHTLDLSVSRLDLDDVLALATWPGLARLTELILSGSTLGADMVAALVDTPHLASLRRLILVACGIDAPGVRALAESPHLAGLRELDLSGNRIGDEGLTALATSPHLGSLTRLRLVSTFPGSRGARALADSPYLQHIEELNLEINPMLGSTPGAAALRRRFGNRVRV
jgi:uncharacterized protein (TIGR02996 family)